MQRQLTVSLLPMAAEPDSSVAAICRLTQQCRRRWSPSALALRYSTSKQRDDASKRLVALLTWKDWRKHGSNALSKDCEQEKLTASSMNQNIACPVGQSSLTKSGASFRWISRSHAHACRGKVPCRQAHKQPQLIHPTPGRAARNQHVRSKSRAWVCLCNPTFQDASQLSMSQACKPGPEAVCWQASYVALAVGPPS